MRRYTVILLLAGMLIAPPLAAAPPPGAASVVQITATGGQMTEQKGTGFVWKTPTTIVTALHVVAGAKNIDVYSESLGKGRPATLKQVHLASDLALLEMQENIGLKVLGTASVDPNSSAELTIWGYPESVPKLRGDHIRFSKSLNAHPTLENLFANAAKLREAVGNQGYPGLKTQILQLSSTIRHGHSGAPIIDQQGRVVGIADGGLYEGIARLNWAIPAEIYLVKLEESKDPFPNRAENGGLFSIATQTREESIPTKDGEYINYVGTLSLRQVMESYEGELAELIPDSDQPVDRLLDAELDIFEDSRTGATFAIPSGLPLQYDADGEFQIVRVEVGDYEMSVLVDSEPTHAQASSAAETYDQLLIDEFLDDGQHLSAGHAPVRIPGPEPDIFDIRHAYDIVDDNGMKQGAIEGVVTVDGPYLMASTLIIRNSGEEGQDAYQADYDGTLLLICSQLNDFAIR